LVKAFWVYNVDRLVAHIRFFELAWLIIWLHLTHPFIFLFILNSLVSEVPNCVSHLLHHNEVLLDSVAYLDFLELILVIFAFWVFEIKAVFDLRKQVLLLIIDVFNHTFLYTLLRIFVYHQAYLLPDFLSLFLDIFGLL